MQRKVEGGNTKAFAVAALSVPPSREDAAGVERDVEASVDADSGDREIVVARGILGKIYSGALSLERATELSQADAKRVRTGAGGQKAINYGEMQADSWSAILGLLELGPQDVFYDLGSGRGALVLQTALEARCKRCVGVELSRERHAMAATAARRLGQLAARAQSAPGAAGGEGSIDLAGAAVAVEFKCVDMQQESLEDATFVYLMNQDLPRRLNEEIFQKVHALPQAVRLLTLCPIRGAGVAPSRTFVSQQTWSQDPIELFLYELGPTSE